MAVPPPLHPRPGATVTAWHLCQYRANWCGLIEACACACVCVQAAIIRQKVKGMGVQGVSAFRRLFGEIETQPPKSAQSENISVNLAKTNSSLSVHWRRVDVASSGCRSQGSVKSPGSRGHAASLPPGGSAVPLVSAPWLLSSLGGCLSFLLAEWPLPSPALLPWPPSRPLLPSTFSQRR